MTTTTIPVTNGLPRTDRICVQTDEEYSAETWWDAARTRIRGCPAAARAWIRSTSEPGPIILDRPDAAALLTWARALPGWDAGPSYAPTPLLFESEPAADAAEPRVI